MRRFRKLKLSNLARLLGMDVSNISAVLRGRKDSRASTFEALAAAMNSEWVLVPREKLAEVKQVLEGKGVGPDQDARSAIDIFLDKNT
jgi:transcriptional regulator with XRE-family HTH domain